MSNTAFSFTSANSILSQPNGSGEKIIFRSTEAADTGNLSITGLVSAVSTTDTAALTGKREKETSDTFTTLSIGQLSAAQTGVVYIYGQGTKATGDVRVDTLPSNNDTLLIGLTGFTQTYTFKSSLTGAANEIKIAASVGAQATNIYEAINAGANAGTDYGTGTAANGYVTASAPVGAVVTLTDKIAVARLLTWALSQGTGTTLSIRTMVGGVTGTNLGYISIGDTTLYDSFSLATEDLGDDTLPALFVGYSSSVNVGGKTCALRFKAENVGTGLDAYYETSTDGTNWADAVTSIVALDDYGVSAPQIVLPEEGNIEYIRFHIENTNTSDVSVDARVIY